MVNHVCTFCLSPFFSRAIFYLEILYSILMLLVLLKGSLVSLCNERARFCHHANT